MAYTFKLDNISPDGECHVAYVKILDDSSVIANLCLPYSGDTESFTAVLEKKMQTVIELHEKKKTAKTAVETALAAVDTEKIVTNAVKAASKEVKA